MATRARWLLRARPADYMLALSAATASLPVVGRHLEPLGGVTAISVWGSR
ncbi:MAG: alpha/beta hydrolase, partial [Mycobacterium sp.]